MTITLLASKSTVETCTLTMTGEQAVLLGDLLAILQADGVISGEAENDLVETVGIMNSVREAREEALATRARVNARHIERTHAAALLANLPAAHRTGPTSVTCPTCIALPGEGCIHPQTGEAKGYSHTSRLMASSQPLVGHSLDNVTDWDTQA